jgi:hypothetical protein
MPITAVYGVNSINIIILLIKFDLEAAFSGEEASRPSLWQLSINNFRTNVQTSHHQYGGHGSGTGTI